MFHRAPDSQSIRFVETLERRLLWSAAAAATANLVPNAINGLVITMTITSGHRHSRGN
jgi:hypothetical protein